MATYTDNYTMTKPTYAEQADISVINANMDIIDNVMHSSQISLAPAYDINETYNTGDIVMHELLMYKCLEDNVTGAWDSTKWTRTTAGEESGGGADLDIYGEASGTAEASFSDGAEASLVECEIGIVPTQDLHGYSKPWAGGANYNKWDEDWQNGYIGNSGQIIADGNSICSNNFNPIDENNTYYGVNPSGKSLRVAFYDSTQTWISNQTVNNTTFTPPSGAEYFKLSCYNYGATYDDDIAINYPSTVTDYSPYANICPISGHTDVTITVASTSGGSGEDTTVSLGRTVYKGWINLTTGEGAITGEYFNLSNAGVTYYKSAQTNCDRFYTKISDIATDMDISGFNNAICDYFDIRTYQSEAVGTFYIQTGWINIQMPKDIFATGAAFKTWIESESVHLEYELATPQTFTLSKEQIQTLLGQNYVSHDGGGNISLVYVKKDSTIIPNPSDAEIPLTGLEISGKDFVITDARIPAPPTTNGAYVLTVTVTGGTPTYSWENA